MKAEVFYRNLNIFFYIIILFSLLMLTPRLFDKDIFFGQVGKQVFTAEVARGFEKNQIYNGLFPIFHFVAPYLDGPTARAEEFPLYAFLTGKLARISGIDLIVSGRIFSFLSFIFLLIITYKICNYFREHFNFPVVASSGPMILALMPVCRTYSVEIMPDMMMVALSFAAIYFYLLRRKKIVFILLTLAILVKYYAIFVAVGLVVATLLDDKLDDNNDNLKVNLKANLKAKIAEAFLYLLSALPCIIFLMYVFYNNILNPITENNLLGVGHISNFKLLISLKFYSRLITWLVLKNSTVSIFLLTILGTYLFFKNGKEGCEGSKRIKRVFLSVIIGQILFMIVFASPFYVHDYYGLSFAVIFALMAAISCNWLFAYTYTFNSNIKSKRYLTLLTILLLLVSLSLSLRQTISNHRKLYYYQRAAELLKKYTKQNDRILIVANHTAPMVLFLSERFGWCIDPVRWFEMPILHDGAVALLEKGIPDKIAVLLLDHELEYRINVWERRFHKWGYARVIVQDQFEQADGFGPPMRFSILEKGSANKHFNIKYHPYEETVGKVDFSLDNEYNKYDIIKYKCKRGT
ncbi:MAG: glycosyltransferase family 39 protein [Oligoflexia bacterium]|nr:glycosyltransferase family 39 protein [Oligoflexia bacterium]